MAWAQFSIRWLIVAIVYAALATVALFRPPSIWQPIFQAAVVGLLPAAVLGIIYRSDHRRAFWTGFLVFGVAAVCVYQTERGRYVMREATENIHSAIERDIPIEVAAKSGWISNRSLEKLKESYSGIKGAPSSITVPDDRTFEEDARFAWLALIGLAGGLLGKYLHATRNRH